ncbi:MAG: hypothetical protein KKE17_10510 [Proteobacteria bacterium]|nr:hypothetical protein [Pseudomonadota bacterium]MBU1710423.1 hypothetical protein [Pseudomonadota bacterium]
MDKLDKVSSIIIIFLILWGGFLTAREISSPRKADAARDQQKALANFYNPELSNKLKVAGNLLINNSLDKAEELIKSLVADFPYDGRPHMLFADLYMRKFQPISAMYEFQNGVDLNPDFLDKKTALFQGKKIRVSLEEAKAAIDKIQNEDAANPDMKQHRKTYYYMKRKIAGSCG